MSKETTSEIAKIAAKILASKSYSPDAKKVAASCLAQREAGVSADDLIEHAKSFVRESDLGGVKVNRWTETFRKDLDRMFGEGEW